MKLIKVEEQKVVTMAVDFDAVSLARIRAAAELTGVDIHEYITGALEQKLAKQNAVPADYTQWVLAEKYTTYAAALKNLLPSVYERDPILHNMAVTVEYHEREINRILTERMENQNGRNKEY